MKREENDDFEALYRENHSRVYAFLFKLCGDHYLAEELTQETFYQAFLSIHRFRGGCEMFTWLASLAKHSYYKYLRKQKKRADEIDVDTLMRYCQDELSESPEEIYMRDVTAQSVRRRLKALPDKVRDVMILRIYAELPFAQIGATLGITENSAKIIYFRAKKKILEEFHDEVEL